MKKLVNVYAINRWLIKWNKFLLDFDKYTGKYMDKFYQNNVYHKK